MEKQEVLCNTTPSSRCLDADGSFFLNQVLTVQEAAAFLKFSTKTVYKYVKEGILPHKKIGGEIRFLLPELIDWMKGD